MFDSYQKSTGTQYTLTISLLLTAFVASPTALFLSKPVGYVSILLAFIVTALCSSLAWNQWKGHSRLTIPSITKQSARTK